MSDIRDEPSPMPRLRLTAGTVELTATVRDTAAARSLVAQLPLSIGMHDFAGVEKVGTLPASLSTVDDPPGAEPEPGDLGYYAPWNHLVLYYGGQAYHDGIVILGRLQGDVDALARLSESITVTVEQT